jgi:hypothetical protein
MEPPEAGRTKAMEGTILTQPMRGSNEGRRRPPRRGEGMGEVQTVVRPGHPGWLQRSVQTAAVALLLTGSILGSSISAEAVRVPAAVLHDCSTD